MQSRQNQYKQMQTKFDEGLQVLEGTVDDEDHLALNAALFPARVQPSSLKIIRQLEGDRAALFQRFLVPRPVLDTI